MQTMYEGKVNSPATTLDGGINNVVTTINIIDDSVLPSAPNIAVIGTGEDAETILYSTKVGNQLSNVTRGFQGVAKAWDNGEAIARLFTEYDYGALKGNVETIAGRKISDFAEVTSEELAGKISDEIGTGKIVLSEEGEWTPSLKFGENSVGMTYDIQSGLYTKIGRKLTVTGWIKISSKGSSVGIATINGLPVVSKNVNGAETVASLVLYSITFANVWQSFIAFNSSSIILAELTEGGAWSYLYSTNFNDNSQIRINATYFTD